MFNSLFSLFKLRIRLYAKTDLNDYQQELKESKSVKMKNRLL